MFECKIVSWVFRAELTVTYVGLKDVAGSHSFSHSLASWSLPQVWWAGIGSGVFVPVPQGTLVI